MSRSLISCDEAARRTIPDGGRRRCDGPGGPACGYGDAHPWGVEAQAAPQGVYQERGLDGNVCLGRAARHALA